MHLPYPPPQPQVCFLYFPIVFRHSHHSFTDPKRKARKSSHPIPLAHLNKPTTSQATINPSSSLPHPPPLSPCTTSNVSSKTLRTSLFISPFHSFLTENAASNPHKPAPPPKATSNPTSSSPSIANAPRPTAAGRKQSPGSPISSWTLSRRCPSLARTRGRG